MLTIGVSLVLSGSAAADRPRGTYIDIDPADGTLYEPEPTGGGFPTLYLDKCEFGCTISPGFENARNNQSRIIRFTGSFSPYPHSDEHWDEVVQCVKNMFEPFNITVTDVDPGGTNYFRAIVAGSPSDGGFGDDVGGVAPATCGVLTNSINYTFAELYSSAETICEVISQETGHVFGMDHQMACDDPMTYLNYCGPKAFQDRNVPCGEYEDRNCSCGGSTQNSYQHLRSIFGDAPPTPPTVAITSPQSGETVRGGFVVRVDAADNNTVEEVRVTVNGVAAGTILAPPYVFNTPSLPDGPVTIEARARDNRGDVGTTTVMVTLDNTCSGDGECGTGRICVDSQCVAEPGADGGLGDTCEQNSDCISGRCGMSSEGQYCTEPCDPSNNACPSGFDCVGTGDGAGVCWPGDGDGGTGGGCAVPGRNPAGSGTGAIALLFGVALLFVGGRRRRR